MAGPDGNLWFTARQASAIGKITPSGTVTLYTNANINRPRAITAGPDGNLWFTSHDNDRIGKITTAGAITVFPVNANVDGLRDHRRR